MPRRRRPLYLISDSSGNLIEHFMKAILTQFPPSAFKVYSVPFINTEASLRETLDQLSEGIIYHALASSELKRLIRELAKAKQLPCLDITGPAVDFLAAHTKLVPGAQKRPVHSLDASYMGRMQAIEFALQHDDSRRLEELGKAEIVLVGISRVSKSPTALFLAYRGYRVANVSWVPAHGMPAPLKKHRKKNVVALTIEPRRLAEIRQRRFATWQLTEEFDYADLREVIHEVRDAEQTYEKRGWPVLETTNLSVEETSTLVLQRLNLQRKLFE